MHKPILLLELDPRYYLELMRNPPSDSEESLNVPYVVICRNRLDMDIRFREFCSRLNAKGLVRKSNKMQYRIEGIDNTVLLFVTEQQYFNPLCKWCQGRIYKIYGHGEQVYHSGFPIKRPSKENSNG